MENQTGTDNGAVVKTTGTQEGSFKDKVADAINQCCMENGCDTPDFILAEYLLGCLDAFNKATRDRDRWYGVHLEPCKKHFYKEGEQK